MNILLTNDDGIYADGISTLYLRLREYGHEVVVVAPASERSAVGHAITTSDPLKVSSVEIPGRIAGYAVQGTPADCVKLAINALLETKPDFVISGINHGANTGNHLIYSGTVSAATEATMFDIPSFAISLDVSKRKKPPHDFSYAANFAARLCATITQSGGLPTGTLLNVNVPGIPDHEIKGVKVARQARFNQTDEYEKRADPYGRLYYWLTLENIILAEPSDSAVDYCALKEGYVALTPIQYVLTDYAMLERLQTWRFE